MYKIMFKDEIEKCKEYKDGRIEWLDTSDHKMAWHEAVEYADKFNKELNNDKRRGNISYARR